MPKHAAKRQEKLRSPHRNGIRDRLTPDGNPGQSLPLKRIKDRVSLFWTGMGTIPHAVSSHLPGRSQEKMLSGLLTGIPQADILGIVVGHGGAQDDLSKKASPIAVQRFLPGRNKKLSVVLDHRGKRSHGV